jgi:hypothetical protein
MSRRAAALAMLVWGCSSNDPADASLAEPASVPADGVSPPDDPLPPPGVPANSQYRSARVDDLPEVGAGTTPESVTLVLETSADVVSVQAAVQDGVGRWVTPCVSHEIYRIGPTAQSWPLGAALTLPLAYDQALPAGFYAQRVRIVLNGVLEIGSFQYFEVTRAGFRRISIEEFSDAVLPKLVGADGRTYIIGGAANVDDEELRDPCPELPSYTDVIDAGAWSRIDFDRWQDVGTLQPLRWRPSQPLPDVGSVGASLVYHARDASGALLTLSFPVPSDTPGPVTLTLGASGSLQLEEPGEPGQAPTGWSAVAGSAVVTLIEDDQLRVDLFDVVLDKGRMYDEPRVTRTVTTGSIRGRWLLEAQ